MNHCSYCICRRLSACYQHQPFFPWYTRFYSMWGIEANPRRLLSLVMSVWTHPLVLMCSFHEYSAVILFLHSRPCRQKDRYPYSCWNDLSERLPWCEILALLMTYPVVSSNSLQISCWSLTALYCIQLLHCILAKARSYRGNTPQFSKYAPDWPPWDPPWGRIYYSTKGHNW